MTTANILSISHRSKVRGIGFNVLQSNDGGRLAAVELDPGVGLARVVQDADGEVEAGAESGGVIQAAGVERDAVDQELKMQSVDVE